LILERVPFWGFTLVC